MRKGGATLSISSNPYASHLLLYLMRTDSRNTSLRKLSGATGMSLQSTRTALKQLEAQGEISTLKTHSGTLVTLGNSTTPIPSPIPQLLTRDEYFLKARNITNLTREEILTAFKAGINISTLIKSA